MSSRPASASGAGRDRHCPDPSAPALERGGVRLELTARRAYVDGKPVAFSEPEFRLLECLLRRAGRIVSQEELLEVAISGEPNGTAKLYRMINRVRDKLGHRRGGQIRTVHRWGLCYQASPEEPAPGTTPSVPSPPAPCEPPSPRPLRAATVGRRLPDAVWALFEPVLPPVNGGGEGHPVASNHRVLHGLLYLLVSRTGWRFVPPCFPRAEAIRRRLKSWLGLASFHEAWAQLARRYEQFQAVDWGRVLLDDWDGAPC